MDAYWAKDIQELFRLQRHSSFQRFAELLFAQSGGMFEAFVSLEDLIAWLGSRSPTRPAVTRSREQRS